MGTLLVHFMLETIIAADLLGVDAFDQPAVEEGKLLARQYLGGRRASRRTIGAMTIRQLPPVLVNRIAAGEVVDAPLQR